MPAPRRVFASERFRDQVDALFESERELGSILEEVARLGVALLFQAVIGDRPPGIASSRLQPAARRLCDDSGAIRSPIPIESDHRFRSIRTPWRGGHRRSADVS